MTQTLSIAWTTVTTEGEAVELAEAILESGFVACVQIDGPIRSFYPWQGKIERDTEFRLTLKLPSQHVDAARERVLAIHPYETPQWIAVEASDVGQGYAQWVLDETKPH